MMLKELTLWTQKLKDGRQLAHSFFQDYGKNLPNNVKKIAFVGMGGSGIAGKIFKMLLEKRTKLVVSLIDSPDLAGHVETDTLAIVVSYSGMTWETLDVLNVLVDKFIPTIVVAHGGRAVEIAENKNLPFTLLPQSLTPRSALGLFLGFFGTLFDLMGLLRDGTSFVQRWELDAERYVPAFIETAEFSDFLALVQDSSFFHVWGVAGDSGSVAYRAATQFNENSKIPAVYSEFPELAHNLLVGFENQAQAAAVLFFYTDFLNAHMTVAIDTITEILKEKRVVLYKPPIFGDTFESQIFTMILWADFASYHLGKVRGVDIEQVAIIQELKKRQKIKGIK